jgi:ubiquinone/menaquinone biosynthesis C-methylase UbiE
MHDHHGQRFQGIEKLRSPERIQWLEVEHVVALSLEGMPIQSAIDIGTGSGIFAEAFAKEGLIVAGIDANPDMLQAARSYVPGTDFRQATAEVNPFPDDSFDLAFMGLVLHETDDLLRTMQEAYRVSKERLVILEWPYTQQDFGPGLEERLQASQVLNLAERAGFATGETINLEHLVLYRFDKALQSSS